MYLKAPYLYIGAQIGSVRFDKFEVLVVDNGSYDILLGKNVFDSLFKMQTEQDTNTVSFSSNNKEDSSPLSFEIYPVEYPFDLLNFEKAMKNLRILHNIALLADKSIKVNNFDQQLIDNMLKNDYGIPDQLKLKVGILDNGSIWVSLKSGSIAGLKYVASFFERGAVAKLSQEVANSQKNEVEANINKETREATIEKILSENEKLKAENIHETYQAFRKECRARLQFFDEIIEQVSDTQLKEQIVKQKQALIEMANLQMVPIVRNVTGSYFSINGPDMPALPPPKNLKF